MGIRQHGKHWVSDWRDNQGRRLRRWHTSEQAARRDLQHQIQIRDATQPQPRTRPKPLVQLAQLWMKTKAGLSPKSINTYQSSLRMLDHLPATTARKLKPEHFAALRHALRQRRINTHLLYLRIIRQFCRWLLTMGYTYQQPSTLLPSDRLRAERRTTTASPGQLAQLARAATPTTALLLVLGARVGLRISEIAAARVQDFDHTASTLEIRSVKNHPHRTNPLPPDAAEYLRDLCAGEPPDQHLTALVAEKGKPIGTAHLRDLWTETATAAGCPQLRPHDLRRTWATAIAEHTSITPLMELAGWTHAATALHYVLTSQAAKRRAVQKEWKAREPEPDPEERLIQEQIQ